MFDSQRVLGVGWVDTREKEKIAAEHFKSHLEFSWKRVMGLRVLRRMTGLLRALTEKLEELKIGNKSFVRTQNLHVKHRSGAIDGELYLSLS